MRNFVAKFRIMGATVFAPESLLAENMKKARVILTDSEEN